MRRVTQITFDGLNFSHVVNALSRQNISVYSASKTGQKCTLTVKTADSPIVVAFLREKCYNNIYAKPKGLSLALFNLKRHVALLCVFVACAVVFSVLQGYCFDVKISGDVDENVVTTALKNHGVSLGGKIPSDLNAVASAVAFDVDASYVSLTRKASVLTVIAVAKSVSPTVDLNSCHDVVATHGGTVESISVFQGTALVKRGDVVKKGDVLIRGKRTFSDGSSVDVCAVGEVKIAVESRFTVTFDGTKQVVADTGKVQKTVYVKIGNAVSPHTPPFENFRSEISETVLSLGVKVVTETYYQTAVVTVPATFDEQQQFLQQQALAGALKNADFTPSATSFVHSGNTVTAIARGVVTEK